MGTTVCCDPHSSHRWSQSDIYQVGILGSCIVINLVNLTRKPHLQKTQTHQYTRQKNYKHDSQRRKENGAYLFSSKWDNPSLYLLCQSPQCPNISLRKSTFSRLLSYCQLSEVCCTLVLQNFSIFTLNKPVNRNSHFLTSFSSWQPAFYFLFLYFSSSSSYYFTLQYCTGFAIHQHVRNESPVQV